MRARDVTHERESDAGATDWLQANSARTIETLEDLLLFLGIDALPEVADGQYDALALALQLQLDALAIGRVLDRVVDQVHHRERERVGVELGERQLGIDLDVE